MSENILILQSSNRDYIPRGALAQLARALDWQSKGHRFDSDTLHNRKHSNDKGFQQWRPFLFSL